MSRFYALMLYAPNAQTGEAVGVGVELPGANFSLPATPAIKLAPSIKYNVITKYWTSNPGIGGQYSAQAQNVIFDILESVDALAYDGVFYVTVEGVSFEDIKQHNNFNRYGLQLYAGFEPGLPLASNQPTPGLIAQGYVIDGIANWVGEDMTLTFVCVAEPFKPQLQGPGNIVLQWQPGQTLAQALQQTLSVAFPGYKLDISLSQNLGTTHTVTAAFQTLNALGQWLRQYTYRTLGPNYAGVYVWLSGGTVHVSDFQASAKKVVQLRYTDLIGQPVWADSYQMDVTVALRADVKAGNHIKLPQIEQELPGLITEAPNLYNAYVDYNTAFKGEFLVMSTRQIGDFRSSDGVGWASVIRCAPLATLASNPAP